MNNPTTLPIFLAFSGNGGVESTMTNLIRAFVARGLKIDLLTTRTEGEHLAALPTQVRIVDLKTRHTTAAAPAVAAYLRRERPRVLLAVKDRAIRSAVKARGRSGADTRLVGGLHTNLTAALACKSSLRRWLRMRPMRAIYSHVDRIIAVSNGVAHDTIALTGISSNKITVIRNAVITPELSYLAAEAVDHPWLQESEAPVILGAGRLTRQKDFATLIRAFALVRRHTVCRLIILGDGGLRPSLTRLTQSLGITDVVDMPGFTSNPFAYMRRAKLFVLSSAWEGSGNVLTEALALGTPVVSTACPSGPDEILVGGRYGKLVAVGDADGLAQAIVQTLAKPLPAYVLREAVTEYTAEASAQHYLHALEIG